MVTIDLRGPTGNALCLIGTAKRWASQLNLPFDPIAKDMLSGDYHHLLDVMDREFGAVVTWVNDPRISTGNDGGGD